jgi:protein phosphatase PTC1
VFETVF